MTNKTTELGRVLRVIGEHGDRLAIFAPSPEQLDEIRRDMDEARRLLAAVRAENGPSRCSLHPTGPVDTEAGGCLLCAMNRRRSQLPAPTAEIVPLETVARTVADEGQDEAVRRYGPRLVTRALLMCRHDLTLTGESA